MSKTMTIQQAELLLRELVACPSVNPTGQQAGSPHIGEARLARLLADKLKALGASVEVTEVAPGRDNVIGRFAGKGNGRSLMLEAHSDTVSVEGMTVDPFAGEVRDSGRKMYGRGTCDTKGAMAAMLMAVESVAADGPLAGDVYFVSTCDEELGGSGARALIDDGFHADAALVGEPTSLEIVHATKGVLRMEISTHGVAAHSSMPQEGVNAIGAMAHVLQTIESRIAPALAARQHPMLGPPTISVGTIRGGSQVNIVPAECTIELDRRLTPGESCDEAQAEIREAVETLKHDDDRATVSCRLVQQYPPFMQAADSDLVVHTARACESVTGQSKLAVAPWAANAGIFADAGIESIIIGPGSIAQAHRCDEFIELDQVVLAARIYEQVIRSFCG